MFNMLSKFLVCSRLVVIIILILLMKNVRNGKEFYFSYNSL